MLQILAFLVVAIAIIVFGLSRMLYGNVTTAELSNKLHGRDWKVESSTAFPLRTNCHVELYSDAHQGEDAPPAIINEDGEKIAYTPGNCWEDVFEAINEAERFIYITGWSVDTTKTLLRTTRKNPEEEEETIGELLTRKAEEGCRVLIHIWDEKMSVAAGGTVQHSGLMCTHDEDTKIFFADSPVEVQLSYRFGELKDHSLVFTHHQKTIIVDAPLFKNEEEAKHKAHEQIAEAKKHLKEKRARRKVEMLRRKQERERRKELRKARRRAGEHVKEEESDEDKKEAEDCSVELQGKGKGKGKGRGRKGGKGRGRGKGKGGKRGGGRRGRKHDDDEEEENNEKEEEEDDGESDGDSEEEEGSGEESEEDEGKDQDRSLDFEFKSERDEAAADGAEAPRLVSFLKEGESMLEHAAEKAHLLPSSTWAGGDRRRVIAFVGGLDICDGRWDTAKHSLFRTLKYEHANDFHNPWPVSHACGPREPWHDIHSKVEGPVAHDILENFVQRWRRQASERKRTRLLDTSPENGFLSTEEDKGNYKSLTESWNVQLFRSVDKFSATIEGIDASIQEAYINTIRTSTRFIYMENQYFLGSCQYWDTNKDAGCVNLIPYELAKRICEFIHKKEQYNVYIVIPMYPEGIPADGAIQEILRWQHYTMRMMYKMVAKAIAEVYGDGMCLSPKNIYIHIQIYIIFDFRIFSAVSFF